MTPQAIEAALKDSVLSDAYEAMRSALRPLNRLTGLRDHPMTPAKAQEVTTAAHAAMRAVLVAALAETEPVDTGDDDECGYRLVGVCVKCRTKAEVMLLCSREKGHSGEHSSATIGLSAPDWAAPPAPSVAGEQADCIMCHGFGRYEQACRFCRPMSAPPAPAVGTEPSRCAVCGETFTFEHGGTYFLGGPALHHPSCAAMRALIVSAPPAPAVGTEPIGARLLRVMQEQSESEAEADDAIVAIMGGAETLPETWGFSHITYDAYDGSFELKKATCTPTKEQAEQLLALGFERFWVCHDDGSETYIDGRNSPWPGHRKSSSRGWTLPAPPTETP